MIKYSVLFLAALAVTNAHAGMLDLGAAMGGANVFTVGDFTSHSSDVEGAIVSGGNVSINGYSVNEKNQAAFVEYSIAAGGDISLSNGSIHNGKTYAGGKTTFDGAAAAPDAGSRPVDFNATSRQFYSMAKDLSNVAATGTVEPLHDGLIVQGSGIGDVDVFHVSSALLGEAADWKLEGLTAGQTLIFNVSGERASFRNGDTSFDALADYNVLFNFYEARQVDVRGVVGAVLAPFATMRADTGVVKGNVVVDSWNSTVQVDAANYFRPVNVPGFREVPAVVASVAQVPPVKAVPVKTAAVAMPAMAFPAEYMPAAPMRVTMTPVEIPEPGTLALLAIGLCAVSWRVVKPWRAAVRDALPA